MAPGGMRQRYRKRTREIGMAKSNYCIMYHNTDPEYVHQVVNGQMQGWSGNGSFCVIFRTADDDRLCKLYDRCESIAAGWTDDNYHAATKFLDSFVHKELTKKEIPNLMGTILAIKIYAGLNNSSLTTGLALVGDDVRRFAERMGNEPLVDFFA